MSNKWPVGNCEPSTIYYEKPDACRMNFVTKHNKIRNLFTAIPKELAAKEGFNVCTEQRLIQPKLNVGPACGKPVIPSNTENPSVWPHPWANLSPNHMGGYVRVVK